MGLLDFFKGFRQGGDPKNPRYWQSDYFFQRLYQNFLNPTNSNIDITSESAYEVAAYWAAVRAISEDIAKLKVKVYSLDSNGNRKPIMNNPVLKVLTRGFNDETDSMTGIQTMVQWMLTFGNAYAEIQRNSVGDIQLNLIHPSRVTVHRDQNGELYYDVVIESDVSRPSKKKTTRIENIDMLHLKGMGNGVVGYSIGEIAAQSLGIAVASQNFTGSFFGNNLSIGAALETPRALDPDVKDAIRKDWRKKFGGSKNTGELAILDRDFKFNRIQMASTDAELLNTRKFQVNEIARWFRIPPHKLMDMTQAKFANLEQNDLNYITDTLTPWIVRLEKQLKFKFHRDDEVYIDFDEKTLTRGDTTARTAYYNALYSVSAITPNQIREEEGMKRSDNPALDMYYMQTSNFSPIDTALKSQELDNEAKAGTLGGGEGEEVLTKVKFDNLKSKFDAYGVAVRAGALTPQTADEDSFRKEAGLPAMSEQVNEAWKDDGGVRRPITLQSKNERDAELEKEFGEDFSEEEQSYISAYLPTMLETINLLVKNEYNAHNLHGQTDKFKQKCADNPVELKQHLDKFYIRHEEKLHDVIEMHLNYLCTVTKKEKPEVMPLVKEAVNMSKSDNWHENRASEICSMILESVAGNSCANDLNS